MARCTWDGASRIVLLLGSLAIISTGALAQDASAQARSPQQSNPAQGQSQPEQSPKAEPSSPEPSSKEEKKRRESESRAIRCGKDGAGGGGHKGDGKGSAVQSARLGERMAHRHFCGNGPTASSAYCARAESDLPEPNARDAGSLYEAHVRGGN